MSIKCSSKNSIHPRPTKPDFRAKQKGVPTPASLRSAPEVALSPQTRRRPQGEPVLFQRWSDLLFLHWEYPAAVLQATLPEGLSVDTHAGRAYLGIIPFFMEGVRPRFLPPVPGLSNFMELNLRTYVRDRSGAQGVWFYSLDANQWLAVKIARLLFHLPYEHAAMHSKRTAQGHIHYVSERSGTRCEFEYAPGPALPPPSEGSLEFFLVERYLLFSQGPRGLRRGAVFHAPYALHLADLKKWDDSLFDLNGFLPTGRPPDHAVVSPGVDTAIFPLENLKENRSHR